MYAPRHRRFETGFVVHREVQHLAQSLAVAIFQSHVLKVQGSMCAHAQ